MSTSLKTNWIIFRFRSSVRLSSVVVNVPIFHVPSYFCCDYFYKPGESVVSLAFKVAFLWTLLNFQYFCINTSDSVKSKNAVFFVEEKPPILLKLWVAACEPLELALNWKVRLKVFSVNKIEVRCELVSIKVWSSRHACGSAWGHASDWQRLQNFSLKFRRIKASLTAYCKCSWVHCRNTATWRSDETELERFSPNEKFYVRKTFQQKNFLPSVDLQSCARGSYTFATQICNIGWCPV